MIKRLRNLIRPIRRTGPEQLKWLLVGFHYDSRIEKVEGEHSHKRVHEVGQNFNRFVTAPCGRQCQHANQISHAALKALDVQHSITRMIASPKKDHVLVLEVKWCEH